MMNSVETFKKHLETFPFTSETEWTGRRLDKKDLFRSEKALNATAQCHCGEEKSEKGQFCASCWDRLPVRERARYVATLTALEDAIASCHATLPTT